MLAVAISLGVGFCYVRWQQIDARAHAPIKGITQALAKALRAPPGADREAAFQHARDAAQEGLRAAAPLLPLDPYPLFLLQATEDLSKPPTNGPSPMDQGLDALRRWDLDAARAHFNAAIADPAYAPRATLYLRLLGEFAALP